MTKKEKKSEKEEEFQPVTIKTFTRISVKNKEGFYIVYDSYINEESPSVSLSSQKGIGVGSMHHLSRTDLLSIKKLIDHFIKVFDVAEK